MIQDLLEKHKIIILYCEHLLDEHGKEPDFEAFQGFLKDLRELEGNQWISIAETKPPFGKWVMCYCRIHGLFLGSYEQIRDTDFGQWDNGNEKGVLPPTHWMELPDVPTIKR